ncbi:MAG TPA: ABC transporter permease subunit [Candidatus Eisenbergiella merdipullorum]|uniref:ABC transporter permease subunit n=1 Tax=Candidatus Eisenbergiella merdipullorum TaxID=2838553 RepID=A0A9D2I4R9_9FIRM|nr:ABC transporter permease subunit [Candidatus Eisenbergiella merdipullorum]
MKEKLKKRRGLSRGRTYAVHSNLKKRLKMTLPLYVLLLPGLIYMLVFKYSPMYGAIIAFKDYKIKDGIWGSEWVGLKWFAKFFDYYECWDLIKNTLRISIYSIIVGMVVSIILALMMNCVKSKVLKNIVQTVTYMPHFVSVVVLVGIVIRFFNPSLGAISKLIQAFGGTDRDLMGVAAAVPHIYVWSGVWQNAGWNTVLYLAALTAVDVQLHEAAIVDGASRLQRVRFIDIPAIVPTIVISLIMNMGSILTVGADKMLLMQNDLNRSTTEVISTYVYSQGIASGNPKYSYASAIGLLNSVISFFLIVVTNQICKKLSDTSLF